MRTGCPRSIGCKIGSGMKAILQILFILIPVVASAELQVKHFFPDKDGLLGHPFFWTIELRYPVWEAYEVKPSSCADLQIRIADRNATEIAGEMRVVYRLKVIPVALKVNCAPTALVSDRRGQSMVLTGKPVFVHFISGDSEEIKFATAKWQSQVKKHRPVLLYALLALFLVGQIILLIRRLYARTPKQALLRDLRKAVVEVQRNRLPVQIWRLLRTELLWGFPAEAHTPAELKRSAIQDPAMQRVADALHVLEMRRYSGLEASWDKQIVERGLNAAISRAGKPTGKTT